MKIKVLMTFFIICLFLINCDVYASGKDVQANYKKSYNEEIVFDTLNQNTIKLEMDDLKVNDKLQGTVRNVVDFGAFVDIGLHDDGLVHISNMAKVKVSHPSQVVAVGDIVDVWVHKIDLEKQKVQLTMIDPFE